MDELISLIKRVHEYELEAINNLSIKVDDIIANGCKDENSISFVFDKLLSMAFSSEDIIKPIYYKLIDYVRKFDYELAKDYDEIYIDQFKDIDDELILERTNNNYN